MSESAPVYDAEFSYVTDASQVAHLLNERAAQGWTLEPPMVPILFKDGNVHSVLCVFSRAAKVRKPLRGSK